MRENGIRPQFINLYKCKNILLEGFTLNRSPFWLIHPLLSENITVRKVKMQSHGYNNDGCDPESSTNVLIENMDFNVGDVSPSNRDVMKMAVTGISPVRIL